jgi:hypothetical protein
MLNLPYCRLLTKNVWHLCLHRMVLDLGSREKLIQVLLYCMYRNVSLVEYI